jgi:hypothetical protein
VALSRTVGFLHAAFCVLVVCATILGDVGSARADEGLPLRARGMLGIASMVSFSQVERMHYDSIGLVSDLQLGFMLFPWLDLQAAFVGGGFSAPDHTGGLLAPLAGATARLPSWSVHPYAFLQLGPGFSGTLVRPFFRTGVGVDVPIAHAFECGPVLGYGQLFQHDGFGYSTDARFFWIGVSLAFRPFAGPDPAQHDVLRIHEVTHHTWLAPPAAEPEPDRPAPDPSPELLSLIEQTLPTERSELLEVQGYADVRGSVEHNQALSGRRAAAVISWLTAHGVAPERLRAAPQGASAPVEPGSDEASYEQNRRVVFRVVQMKAVQ